MCQISDFLLRMKWCSLCVVSSATTYFSCLNIFLQYFRLNILIVPSHAFRALRSLTYFSSGAHLKNRSDACLSGACLSLGFSTSLAVRARVSPSRRLHCPVPRHVWGFQILFHFRDLVAATRLR